VGMKGQRHPEFYIPDWALQGTNFERGAVVSENPALRQRALTMVAMVVSRYAESAVIDSWAAENEPYVDSSRTNRYSLSREYVNEVAATIRANDPGGRPVVVNHGQHFVMDQTWRDILADADILGQSLYPRRNESFLGFKLVFNVLELGPLMPNYAFQARKAHKAGKEFWIVELQGEPWTDEDSRLLSPQSPSPNLSPGLFEENVAYARKSGADRVYLWGSEWWLYQSEHFADDRWFEAARGEIAR